MAVVEEAREILRALGLPKAQQSLIAGYTLLALAGLTASERWTKARRPQVRVHDILIAIERHFGKKYAENTRETIRRQVLHQFEQARVVDRNPGQPNLPTNSPRTHYALTTAALRAVRSFGTREHSREIRVFRGQHGALMEVYRGMRSHHMVPVRLASGLELQLSPGRHNQVQRGVIEQFAPRFAPGALPLYVGDAANKTLFIDERRLERLGIAASKHGKLPDIMLLDQKKRRLLLIEVVTSHGPVTPKRKRELEALCRNSPHQIVFVTALPEFKEFKRHLEDIAWETEVWIAEIPDHIIHYNGDKFLT